MALLNQSSKLVVVLVLVIALFAFIVGLLVGLPLQVVSLNTASHNAEVYGWIADGGNPGGEFLDASQYVSSWSPSLDSEKIVIKANVRTTGFTLACVTEYRYKVHTTSNGVSWNELSTSPYTFKTGAALTGGPIALQTPSVFALRGLYEGGIRVILEFHIKDGCLIDKGFLFVGEDQAYLRSGVGSVRAPAGATVGDQVSVCVDVPYVNSEKEPGKGWLLYGFSSAQNREILRVDPIATSGTTCYAYTVSSVDFVQSPSCTTENRLEWHLFNELWAKDFAFTTTVDATRFRPSIRITSISGDREVGKPVTIAWNATPNPSTRYPILRVVLAYGYGAPDNELTFTPDKTSHQITPGSGGVIHVELYAVDTGCRPSPAARVDLQIREPGQGGAPTVEPNLLLFILPIVLMAIVGVVAAAFVPGSVAVKVLVFIVLLLFGFLLAIALVPAVLFPGG